MLSILPDKVPTFEDFVKENNPTDSLLVASQLDIMDTTRLAIEQGADVNAKDRIIGHNALINATINNNIKMVELLVNNNEKVDLGDNNGMTPLMYATYYGYYDLVRYFLKKTKNRLIKDSEGEDALFHAVSGDQLDDKMIKILIDSGAFDVDAINNYGDSPIFKALLLDNDEAVKRLVDKGADINIKNKRGSTLKDQAIILKKSKILKYIDSLANK